MDRHLRLVQVGEAGAVTAGDLPPVAGTSDHRLRDRRRLLQVGHRLGWSRRDMRRFAESVGHRPWQELDADDLVVTLGEFRRMLLALTAHFVYWRCRAGDISWIREDVDGRGD